MCKCSSGRLRRQSQGRNPTLAGRQGGTKGERRTEWMKIQLHYCLSRSLTLPVLQPSARLTRATHVTCLGGENPQDALSTRLTPDVARMLMCYHDRRDPGWRHGPRATAVTTDRRLPRDGNKLHQSFKTALSSMCRGRILQRVPGVQPGSFSAPSKIRS